MRLQRLCQGLGWLLGVLLMATLIWAPPLGVMIFWNFLIPMAPAILVFCTGWWRNVCPLATTSLQPDRLGWSLGLKPSTTTRHRLGLVAVLALLILTPLRHVSFNTSGWGTAILLGLTAGIAVGMGFVFERRSGWCTSLCPVHPVEKLYGHAVVHTLPNAQCGDCVRCSLPCPDWTPRHQPPPQLLETPSSRLTNFLIIGAFPGWIWGWFLVPDDWSLVDASSWLPLYGFPALGAWVTGAAYLALRWALPPTHHPRLIRAFAAASVSVYYLFRLPQWFGFNPLHDNGCLINLTQVLPWWAMPALNLATTALLVWWIFLQPHPGRPWSHRPPTLGPRSTRELPGT